MRVEDPKCPYEWRGSGCYDIDVPAWQWANVIVNASTLDDAKNFSRREEYSDCGLIKVEYITVVGADVICDSEPGEKEGVLDVEFGTVQQYGC